jgi:hypothetical protein
MQLDSMPTVEPMEPNHMKSSRLARTLTAASLCASAFLLVHTAFALEVHISGSASTTTNGNTTQDPVPVTFATNPDGSRSVSGSGSVGAFGVDGGEDHYAGVSGEAFAGPGTLRAFAHGLALNFSHVPNIPPLADALGAIGNFGGSIADSILVTSSVADLSPGDAVSFLMTLHLSGGSVGTQRVGGQFDVTSYQPGSFALSAYAGLNAGTNYYFPNGLFTGVPDSLTFDIPITVQAQVGDLVPIFYSLGVGVEDRTGLWPSGTTYPNSESIVDVSNTLHVNIDAITAGIVLTSDSAFDYSTPVPEPTPLALHVCAGAVLAMLSRRRRRRTASPNTATPTPLE